MIDIGPGAGSEGGRLVAAGPVEDTMKCKESVTGRFLASPEIHNGIPHRPVRPGKTPTSAVLGASLHNLRIPKVEFPLNRLTVVTGVSGSGKSSLCRDLLLRNLQDALRAKDSAPVWTGCR